MGTGKAPVARPEMPVRRIPFAINERQGYLTDAKFLLYTSTTVLDELDLDTEEYMGIIVAGDLQINGSIINENTDGACSLIVLETSAQRTFA